VRFEETPIAGAWIVDIEPAGDERGWFARTFAADEFRAHGLDPSVVHCNMSFNTRAGTLRGLHWQADPHGEAKLVRCVRGAAFDVIVDLRPGSSSERHWVGIELSAANGRSLYIPAGLAHGFQTLEDGTQMHYQMSHEYMPSHVRGFRWDDPAIAIDWPAAEERFISERDLALPTLDP
jgi:dTDP-4-dehydrorhamnose 3,5-epimerase